MSMGFAQTGCKEKYDPYSFPTDASSKCMFQLAPLKAEAGGAVFALAGFAVAGTTCPAWVGHEQSLCRLGVWCMLQLGALTASGSMILTAVQLMRLANACLVNQPRHPHQRLLRALLALAMSMGFASDWVYGACYDLAKNSFSQCLDQDTG